MLLGSNEKLSPFVTFENPESFVKFCPFSLYESPYMILVWESTMSLFTLKFELSCILILKGITVSNVHSPVMVGISSV